MNKHKLSSPGTIRKRLPQKKSFDSVNVMKDSPEVPVDGA
jgi:hypothetical protein